MELLYLLLSVLLVKLDEFINQRLDDGSRRGCLQLPELFFAQKEKLLQKLPRLNLQFLGPLSVRVVPELQRNRHLHELGQDLGLELIDYLGVGVAANELPCFSKGFSHKRKELVFNLVVRSAGQVQRHLLPFASHFLVQVEQQRVFVLRPLVSAQQRVELVDPPLSALLRGFIEPTLNHQL